MGQSFLETDKWGGDENVSLRKKNQKPKKRGVRLFGIPETPRAVCHNYHFCNNELFPFSSFMV